MIKLGLIGFGHLGKIHAKCLKDTDFELVGIVDPLITAKSIDGVKVYGEVTQLLEQVDACIIAASTATHFELASLALKYDCHCLIEKPMTATLSEAEELAESFASQPNLICQVGFVERFNPAYQFVRADIKDPKFIEVHRLAQFNLRGNEVSVVYDLMIHDLNILLTLKPISIKDVKATGVKVFTDSLDICNARIEFVDGSVANVTASRMSLKDMRKFRIFQENSYISMDLQAKESQIINLADQAGDQTMMFDLGDTQKHIELKSSGTLNGNAILDEQLHFYNCIVALKQPTTDIQNALLTTRLAQQIEDLAYKSIV